MINNKTKLYAIIGNPIKHSFSPQMQNAWFKQEKLNRAYLSFEVESKNLKKAVEAFKLLKFEGINVTIPHKTNMLKLVDFSDKAAKSIGSINTVTIKNGKLYGYNTDHSGLSADLLSKNIKVRNKNVLVFGAGGAARAVVYALKNSGAAKIYISNRTFENAKKIAKFFKVTALPVSEISKVLQDSDLLINASACGMKKRDALPFKTGILNKNIIIYDLIYNKLTPFAKLAKENSLKYFTGEGMLINQGAYGFKIWTGIYPDTKKALKLLKKIMR